MGVERPKPHVTGTPWRRAPQHDFDQVRTHYHGEGGVYGVRVVGLQEVTRHKLLLLKCDWRPRYWKCQHLHVETGNLRHMSRTDPCGQDKTKRVFTCTAVKPGSRATLYSCCGQCFASFRHLLHHGNGRINIPIRMQVCTQRAPYIALFHFT